jgi:outer membrane receptor protein involved in Fe transport
MPLRRDDHAQQHEPAAGASTCLWPRESARGNQVRQLDASLFANNLFNKEALLDTQPQINLQTAAFTRYIVNQPVTVGVDLSYKFGQ